VINYRLAFLTKKNECPPTGLKPHTAILAKLLPSQRFADAPA
jgi:hypothetical protein